MVSGAPACRPGRGNVRTAQGPRNGALARGGRRTCASGPGQFTILPCERRTGKRWLWLRKSEGSVFFVGMTRRSSRVRSGTVRRRVSLPEWPADLLLIVWCYLCEYDFFGQVTSFVGGAGAVLAADFGTLREGRLLRGLWRERALFGKRLRNAVVRGLLRIRLAFAVSACRAFFPKVRTGARAVGWPRGSPGALLFMDPLEWDGADHHGFQRWILDWCSDGDGTFRARGYDVFRHEWGVPSSRFSPDDGMSSVERYKRRVGFPLARPLYGRLLALPHPVKRGGPRVGTKRQLGLPPASGGRRRRRPVPRIRARTAPSSVRSFPASDGVTDRRVPERPVVFLRLRPLLTRVYVGANLPERATVSHQRLPSSSRGFLRRRGLLRQPLRSAYASSRRPR